MADETLSIKIVVDDSQSKSAIKNINKDVKDTKQLAEKNTKFNIDTSKLKNDLNRIKSDIKNTFSASKLEVKTGINSSDLKATEESVQGLTSDLESLKAINIGSLLTQFNYLIQHCGRLQRSVRGFKEAFNGFPKVLNDSLKIIKNIPKTFEFKNAKKDLKHIRDIFKDISDISIKKNVGKQLFLSLFGKTNRKQIAESFKQFYNNGITNGLLTLQLERNVTAIINSLNHLKMRFINVSESWHDAAQNIKEASKELINQFKELWPYITKALSTVTIIGSLLAMISSIKNSIKVAAMGDEIRDNAQKVFMSTSAYQEWGYVLQQNGVDVSTLNMAMRQFSKTFATDNALMAKYGITAKSTSKAFEQAVFAIQNMETETERVSAMTELFGTRAASMMTIFNLTNESTKELMATYRAIGGTMSDELIRKSDALTDAITAMKAAWQGLRNTLAETLMPILLQVVEWLTVTFAKVSILVRHLLGLSSTFDTINDGAKEKSDSMSAGFDAANSSASKLKKTLMSFDELNILNGETGAASGIDLGDYESFGSNFAFDSDTIDKISGWQQKVSEMKRAWEGVLPNVIMLVGALGAAFLFLTGHPIAAASFLVAAGLSEYIITQGANGWEGSVDELKSVMKTMAGIALEAMGSFMVVKGAFTNNWALILGGLALIPIGASLITSGLNNDMWSGELTKIKTAAGSFSIIAVSVASIALGIKACILGAVWLGIPLIIAGAAGIGVGVGGIAGANSSNSQDGWNQYINKFKNITSKIAEIAVIISSITVGIALCILGLPAIGVPLLVAGGVGVVGSLSFKDGWSDMLTSLRGTVDEGIKEGNRLSKGWTDAINQIKNAWKTFKQEGVLSNEGVTQQVNEVKQQADRTAQATQAATQWNKMDVFEKRKYDNDYYKFRKQIYGFAKGGVLKAPTLGLLAEYPSARSNPEVIAPQNIIRQTIDASNNNLVSAFVQIGRQIMSTIEDKELEVKIGDEAIAKSAAKGNNNYKKKTGVPLIV